MALWMLVSIFAGVYSFWGVIPIFIADFVFLSIQYLGGALNFDNISILTLSSVLPTIIGSIVWHNRHNSSQKTYLKSRSVTSELNELASKSEVVINAIGDGVMAIDSQGIVQFINPAAQHILGWSAQDSTRLNYKSVLQLLDQENNPLDISNDPIQQVLNTNQQLRTNSLSITTKAGKKIIISLVVSPVGEIGSGIIAVFHDITAEKAEEREQAEFISTASHEMRTPVASIEGYLGLALNPQTAQIDDRARDYIQKAHKSAEHLGRLFQDLLDVSRADDGRASNNPTIINLVPFIKDAIQGLKPHAEAKNIRLVYKPMPDDNALDKTIAPVFLVNLDADHVREVIDNLVENAIKYTIAGEVTVDMSGDENNVVISIKDSGIGIPAEDIPHLFQKFYRVDNKDTREIGGTGLGLYLSRKLVELMGGRIWAESTYTKGTTFFVELPRLSSQEEARLSEQEKTPNQSMTTLGTEQAIQQFIAPTQEPFVPYSQPNPVPRGQALTPAQISEYVAKQRVLVAKENQLTQQNQVNTPTGTTPLTTPQNQLPNQNTAQNQNILTK